MSERVGTVVKLSVNKKKKKKELMGDTDGSVKGAGRAKETRVDNGNTHTHNDGYSLL